jgi:fumarate hydratase class II
MDKRIERDTMGEIEVPGDALYGAQTARAIENFPVSGMVFPRELIWAMGLIKHAAAAINQELGKLSPDLADAIMRASQDVIDGKLDDHFPVDIFQTGSGTSTNMNANEVISNRAIQLLGGAVGSKTPVHPNDHVNMGQSSNDVFPSAIHIAAITMIENRLLPALEKLRDELKKKAEEFDSVVKIGRTHLQDATPIRLGQEFSGYASQMDHGIGHIRDACDHLRELAIGGTAVGTGINTHPEFGKWMAANISELSGVRFVEADNHFEAQAAQDAAIQMSGSLKTVAVSLIKIANDIRWLGSGPRLGLGELEIPATQPGSSIMPGKTNPVIAESLIMVCAQVIGNDAAITIGGLSGNFELNVMLPLIARNLLEQIRLLANASENFSERLIMGLKAQRVSIEQKNESSLSLATALAPIIGYERAADIAKKAHETGKTVRQIALESKVLPKDQLDEALDLYGMTDTDNPG